MNFFLKMFIGDKSSTKWNKYLKVAFVAVNEYLVNQLLEYKNFMFMTKWEIDFFSNLDETNS
jgi:hypothetical protein